jgi:hypothetical protein
MRLVINTVNELLTTHNHYHWDCFAGPIPCSDLTFEIRHCEKVLSHVVRIQNSRILEMPNAEQTSWRSNKNRPMKIEGKPGLGTVPVPGIIPGIYDYVPVCVEFWQRV